MKRTFLGICAVAFISWTNNSYGQTSENSQESTKVLPNGVVVHQAIGVEGIVITTTETPVAANSIENWNEEQIREAISYINVKKTENCSVKESLSYDEQLKVLEEKLKQLESKK